MNIPRELEKQYDITQSAFEEARNKLWEAKQNLFQYCVENKIWVALALSGNWRRFVK
jgi:hypothetical protein